jgi:hypothetical protein
LYTLARPLNANFLVFTHTQHGRPTILPSGNVFSWASLGQASLQ